MEARGNIITIEVRTLPLDETSTLLLVEGGVGAGQLPEAASVAPIDSTDKEVLPGILQWRFRLSESQGHT